MQYASVIHSSGTDLLRLLNDILDLAKVESGTVTLEISELPLAELQRRASSATSATSPTRRASAFSVELDDRRCRRRSRTDPGRLRQVLKNLLSNAFKFTERGEVSVRIAPATAAGARRTTSSPRRRGDRRSASPTPGSASRRSCSARMFEAFAQADGTTARQYGGTGLGLSISRELVRLLGGEIALAQRARTRAARSPSTCRRRAPRAGRRRRPPASGRRPTRSRSCRRAPSRAPAPRDAAGGRRPGGHEGAGGRRRLPQHLRAHGAARARRARGRLGRERRRRASTILERDARHRHRARWTS